MYVEIYVTVFLSPLVSVHKGRVLCLKTGLFHPSILVRSRYYEYPQAFPRFYNDIRILKLHFSLRNQFSASE